MFPAVGAAYDPIADSWASLVNASPTTDVWKTMAPVNGDLWAVRNNAIYVYHPSTDTWATVLTISGGDDANMTESDEFGHVYGHTADGHIVDYDTVNNVLNTYPTGLGNQFETRLGYDPIGRAIFFGSFSAANVYRFDLTTHAITQVQSHPEVALNDIFCSDRSGHIYAAGAFGGTTIWQYTIATNTWAQLPLFPIDHGNNGSCTVSETGYLYVGTGQSDLRLYRIALY